MGHILLCALGLFLLNALLYGHAEANRPKAELRSYYRDIPVGGSVTLTCSVNTSSSGWKYFWYRGEKTSEPLTSELSAGPIRVSEEGVYWCRGGRGDPVYYTENSDPITIYKNVPNKAVVTLQTNWSEIYRGERITLRCEIKDGGDTEWEYEWKRSSSEKLFNQNEYRIRYATESHSGLYRCKGRKKSEKSSTDWSDPFRLTVSDQPQSVLTVSPSWLSAGASVTLNCSVKDQSAGWRFYWFKTAPKISKNRYSTEQLPGSSNGNRHDSYIVHGQTHTARYLCKAGRGDPEYRTDYSRAQYTWSADFHSSASLTVSPDRAQHFTSDSVSLSCEGNSTEWKVKRLVEGHFASDCSYWGTMTGSTCKLNTYLLSDAVYWCESGSGEFSNAVNITVQAQPVSFSFAVPLIFGLVSGIIVVIPLLAIFCYRASNDSCFAGPVQSESANTDRVDYENDHYSTLLHGDVCLYETVRGRQEAGHGMDEEPEESAVYMNVQRR